VRRSGARHLGLPDGGLASATVLAEAAGRLRKTLMELRPDAVVTWGPDGGYGHPDHRLVSALVTQVVQAGGITRLLYYPGLPASRMDEKALAALKFSAPFAPTLDEFLDVRVPYAAEDAARARAALACHVSQFTPQAMQMISMLTEKVHAGAMHLRLWNGSGERTDLFE
jgi:LmbE family N-acetylglucosaminyl deacetylase